MCHLLFFRPFTFAFDCIRICAASRTTTVPVFDLMCVCVFRYFLSTIRNWPHLNIQTDKHLQWHIHWAINIMYKVFAVEFSSAVARLKALNLRVIIDLDLSKLHPWLPSRTENVEAWKWKDETRYTDLCNRIVSLC